MTRLLPMLVVAVLTVLAAAGVSADIPEEEWNKTFGGSNDDEGRLVQQTSEGGYIIAGYTASYGAGGRDVWLIKTDDRGNEQWNKTFGGSYDDRAYSVQQTTDGGFVVVGYTNSYGDGSLDVYLIKTDHSGDEQWSKTLGGLEHERGYSVKQTSDGGYIIAGSTESYGAGVRDVWLIKTDASGNEQWNKTFGSMDYDYECGWSVQQTSDGGFIIAAHAYHTHDYLIKTDANGNEQWNKTLYGFGAGDAPYSVQQTSDGGFIVAGATWCAGANYVHLIKTDAEGDEAWNKTFGRSRAYSVQQTSDDGFILAGMTCITEVYLIKTDASGNEEWSKTFGAGGSSSWNIGYSVQQAFDGGYIIAGYTESYGAGGKDVWLIKVGAGEEPNQPPTCAIELQKNGIPIDNIDVGEFFDIYVGDSTDDYGIKEVRFSSDDSQDGNPTGEWTDWYDWDTSSEDWDAANKIKAWAFATGGVKEVWADVKDSTDQTGKCSANIYANPPPFSQPVITSPLEITPIKNIYYVGDNLNAEFTITNRGGEPVTFDVLTVGGRLNGWCPIEGCPDFTHRSLTLQPDESYHYGGSLALTQSGNYHFFIAYYIQNPTPDEKKLLDENNWNTCVDLGEGLTHTDRIKNIIVLEEEIPDPDTVSELRDKITRELHRQVYYPPYLRDTNSFTSAVATVWASFTSWITQTHLTEKYDELDQAGIDYESLRFKALINARDSLDRGDIVSAKKYLQKSYTYGKLSAMSFGAAAEVFEDNLEAGEILAEGVKDRCDASVNLGLGVTNPVAAKAADYVYIGVDYAVDRALLGEEPAAKNAAVSAVVTMIFNGIPFGDLGDRTIADYTENRIGKVTFPMLQKAFQNNENLQFALSKIIKECGVGLGDEAVEDLVSSILDELEHAVDLEQIEVKSPVELWVCDSRGGVTGLLHGAVEHGISRSMYCDGTVTILYPLDSYRYEVVGTDEGTYGLDIASIEDGTATFTGTDIPTSPNAMHRYTIDWDALSQGEEGATVQVDSDGDGVFERTIIADNELTADEFGEAPPTATSTSATGTPKDTYSANEDVYAAGSGFTPGTNVDIHVVQDQDWNDGDQIPQDITGSVETVPVVDGDIAPVLIWHAPLVPGRYDIVIDANRNGDYDAATDGLDSGSPGFVVIGIPPPASVPVLTPDRDHRSDRFAVCYRDGQDRGKVQIADGQVPSLDALMIM